jgi:hypothetical protein
LDVFLPQLEFRLSNCGNESLCNPGKSLKFPLGSIFAAAPSGIADHPSTSESASYSKLLSARSRNPPRKGGHCALVVRAHIQLAGWYELLPAFKSPLIPTTIQANNNHHQQQQHHHHHHHHHHINNIIITNKNNHNKWQ